MAVRIGTGVWSIQGEALTLPVHIPRAELTAAVYRADPGAAGTVLAHTPLTPLSLAGHALSMLMCVHYDQWALRSYDEVGVGLIVRGPGGRPGLYLADLPVTGEFTREAGQDFWALPKWMMRCDLTFGDRATRVTVRDGGAEVLEATLGHGGPRLPGVRAFLPSWSYLDHGAQAGRLLRGRVPMRLSGVRAGRGGSHLSLGSHPMAHRMRTLGMLGRPLFTVHADRLSGPLGEFRPVETRARA